MTAYAALGIQLLVLACIVTLLVWGGGKLFRLVRRDGPRILVTPLLIAVAVIVPQIVFLTALARTSDDGNVRTAKPAYPSRAYSSTGRTAGVPVPITETANENFVGDELQGGALPLGTLPSVDAIVSFEALHGSASPPTVDDVAAIVERAVGADGGVAEGWTPFVEGEPALPSKDTDASACLPPRLARQAMAQGAAVAHVGWWQDLGEADVGAWRASPTLVRFIAVTTRPDEDLSTESATSYGLVYGGGLETPDVHHANGMSIGIGMGAVFAVPSAAALSSVRGLRPFVSPTDFDAVRQIVNAATTQTSDTYGVGEGWVPFENGRPVMGEGGQPLALDEEAAVVALKEGAWTGNVGVAGAGPCSVAAWRAGLDLVRYVYLPEEPPPTAISTSDAPSLKWALVWLAMVALSGILVVLVLVLRARDRSPSSEWTGDARRRSLRTRIFVTVLASMILPQILLVGLVLLALAPILVGGGGDRERPGDPYFEYGENLGSFSGDWALAADWSSSRRVTDENADLLPRADIVASLAEQESRLPQSAYKRMLAVLRGRTGQDRIGEGGFAAHGDESPEPGDLPWTAARDLEEKGWSVGEGSFEGSVGQYAAWMDGDSGYYFWRSGPAEDSGLEGWWARHITGAFQVGLWVALFVVSASVAAFLLSRRIARPVADVAAASRRLAAGELPGRIEVSGPREIAALAESFNHMAEKLRKAQETERDFLMSVGHELKTPLTAIDGYAELLEDEAVDPKQAAKVLGLESSRLRRLITDLLDLARIGRSEFTVVDEPVDLADTAREVVARFENLAATLGVALAADAPAPALARGDTGRLLQAASNLVENALRATRSGDRVDVVARPGLLSVRDTGPGLTEEDVAHAFERFYLHRKYAEGPEVGTGLGLAIVKDLVEAMGGYVEVESAAGAGSTFSVHLPAADAESSVAAGEAETGA